LVFGYLGSKLLNYLKEDRDSVRIASDLIF